MSPYDRLTIIRNRHRAKELARFRQLVETYFERSEYVDDMPIDWDGARAARARINQMLPRITETVDAARLSDTRADPGVLRQIFTATATEDEILDLIDMALGVYEADQYSALWRTVSPLHHAGNLLGFILGMPRRALIAIGFPVFRRSAKALPAEQAARLEAAASRIADNEAAIQRAVAEMREMQEHQFARAEEQLADMAERIDFAERMLAQNKNPGRLPAPEREKESTPV